MFCIVFCVQKASLIFVSWESFVNFLTCLPLCLKVTHFDFFRVSVSVLFL
jgi:hypothetical protein